MADIFFHYVRFSDQRPGSLTVASKSNEVSMSESNADADADADVDADTEESTLNKSKFQLIMSRAGQSRAQQKSTNV